MGQDFRTHSWGDVFPVRKFEAGFEHWAAGALVPAEPGGNRQSITWIMGWVDICQSPEPAS